MSFAYFIDYGGIIHAGIAQTLAQICEEYWIPQSRVEVSCNTVLNVLWPSFRLSHMPHGHVQVSQSHPFQFVGLDYFCVETYGGFDKIWICLFTCLLVQTIHFRLLHNF